MVRFVGGEQHNLAKGNQMNMSYCRFENTYGDLRDCYRAMQEDENGDLSQSETEYKKKLIELCEEIVSDFSEEIEVDEDEDVGPDNRLD